MGEEKIFLEEIFVYMVHFVSGERILFLEENLVFFV